MLAFQKRRFSAKTGVAHGRRADPQPLADTCALAEIWREMRRPALRSGSAVH